jgi:O-antigen/teichoic acid export membrane protein
VLWAAPCIAVTNYIDPIVLRRSVSHAEVGRYQLAYLTIMLCSMAGASFNGVLSPELVGAQARGDGRALDRYRDTTQPRLALALGLCLYACACVAAPMLAPLLPAAWAGAAELVAVLTIAGGLMLAVWTYYPLVTATDSTAVTQVAIVCGAGTNLAIDLMLAPRFGAVGVALANVAAWSAQLLLVSGLMRRRIGARRQSLVLVLVAVPVAAVVVGATPLAVRAGVALVLIAGALRAASKSLR